MTFWKITPNNKPEKVAATKLKNEQILERSLEDWIESNPDILGEPLLLIGRQIIIPEVKDRLDLLALDPNGHAVIIELKRGKMSDPIDMQALRYASYISKWQFEDFEIHAKSYLGDGEEFNFNEQFEAFCIKAGVDEIPDINSEQRIIIAGSEVKDRLGSVALWLHEHNIRIKVIEIDSYKEGETLLIQPRIVVPLEVNKYSEVGKSTKGDVSKPWITAGKSWHLEKKMKSKARDMFLVLDNIIQDELKVEGPFYNQKNYISYQIGGYNWLLVITYSNYISLLFPVRRNSMNKEKIANQLGVEQFDSEDTLSEKLSLPSSINIKQRNEHTDRISLRLKDDFDLSKPEFLQFLKETIKNFTKA